MKGIVEVLRSMDRGNFLNDAENELATVVQALEERGKGNASITIKIELKSKDEMIFANGSIVSKEPPVNRKDALFYIDGGTLTRKSPQQEMKIEAVKTEPEEEKQNG